VSHNGESISTKLREDDGRQLGQSNNASPPWQQLKAWSMTSAVPDVDTVPAAQKTTNAYAPGRDNDACSVQEQMATVHEGGGVPMTQASAHSSVEESERWVFSPPLPSRACNSNL
jgi:hypothetical protein